MPASPPAGHWQRFRRLLGIVGLTAVASVVAALAILDAEGVVLRPHLVIALTLGVGGTILLAGALMGLVFVSARSGHDENVKDLGNDSNDRSEARSPWQ